MRFNLLGSLEFVTNGRLVSFGGINHRMVMGLLLLNSNSVVPTSRIISSLWPDEVPASARKMVQNSVAALRRMLADEAVELLTSAPGYLFRVDPEALDMTAFRRLVRQGRAERDAGAWREAAQTLRRAEGLWRGGALADLAEHGIAWPELAALDEQRLSAFEDRVQVELDLGLHRELVGELEIAVTAHPARERLYVQLMLALYRCSRQQEALAVYQRARTALVDGFGLDPGRELQRLERAILNQSSVLLLPARPAGPAGPAGLIGGQRPEARPGVDPLDGSLDDGLLERARASIFLLDARFGSRPETSSPETHDRLVKELTSEIRNEVQRRGGTLRRTVGSEWLAVFGLPHSHPDDWGRAVAAATALQERLGREGAAAARLGLTGSRVAVASGDVVATYRRIGASDPDEVTGEVLDRCREMLIQTRLGEVRVGTAAGSPTA